MKWYKQLFYRYAPISHRLKHLCEQYENLVMGEIMCDIRYDGELDLMRVLLPHCRSVFDVGFNLGDWSALALEINPNLQIHGFEADPGIFDHARQRFEGKGSVVVNPAGLSVEAGKRVFYSIGGESGLGSMYQHPEASLQRPVEITFTTVTEYCRERGIQHIDYMKIDVEGGEFDVMRGAETLMNEGKIDFIHFEYGPGYISSRTLLLDIMALAERHGYGTWLIHPRKLVRVDSYARKYENFKTKYFLLARSDSLLRPLETGWKR